MTPTPNCYKCKNFNFDTRMLSLNCKAFPDEIPDVIINNKVKHTQPFKGDNGIQFEPIK